MCFLSRVRQRFGAVARPGKDLPAVNEHFKR